jgi:hypothetical protein
MEDALAVVTATKDCVRRLGGSFMKSPEARRGAAAAGLARFTFYFHGRAGVLAPASADVVTAAFGFFPAGFVRQHWDPAAAGPAEQVLPRYAEVCQAWGRRCLGGFADAERLAELMEQVADGAEAAGVPLFAGWRAVPRPADPPARAALAAHVLREHRGGLHLVAVRASGLAPVDAVLCRAGGPERARFLGWAAQRADADPGPEVRRRRDAAERLTDELATAPYAALGADRLSELAHLLRAAYPHAMAEHLAPATAQG